MPKGGHRMTQNQNDSLRKLKKIVFFLVGMIVPLAIYSVILLINRFNESQKITTEIIILALTPIVAIGGIVALWIGYYKFKKKHRALDSAESQNVH